MAVAVATLVDGVLIRLTDERWAHIVDRHRAMVGRQAEVLDAMEHPDEVLAGEEGELLSVRKTDTYIWWWCTAKSTVKMGSL